jgi:hypothetical protein
MKCERGSERRARAVQSCYARRARTPSLLPTPMAIRPISWRVLAIILDDQEGGTCGSIDLPVPAGGDDDRLADIGGAGAVAGDPRATGPPSELAWPDSGATVSLGVPITCCCLCCVRLCVHMRAVLPLPPSLSLSL